MLVVTPHSFHYRDWLRCCTNCGWFGLGQDIWVKGDAFADVGVRCGWENKSVPLFVLSYSPLSFSANLYKPSSTNSNSISLSPLFPQWDSTLKQLPIRMWNSMFGMWVDKTKFDLCGDITSLERRDLSSWLTRTIGTGLMRRGRNCTESFKTGKWRTVYY